MKSNFKMEFVALAQENHARAIAEEKAKAYSKVCKAKEITEFTVNLVGTMSLFGAIWALFVFFG